MIEKEKNQEPERAFEEHEQSDYEGKSLRLSQSSEYDPKLHISVFHLEETQNISFLEWHRRMEDDHSQLRLAGRPDFSLWNWCNCACAPCRWFGDIPYDARICKCCKFSDVMSGITFLLICSFLYAILISIFEDKVLPGSTFFFIGLMFLTASVGRFLLELVHGPTMLGMLGIGVMFRNIPGNILPRYKSSEVQDIVTYAEPAILAIALIRAGLLMDLARLKHRVLFIFILAAVPLIFEFAIIVVTSHYFLQLPWNWSALHGSILCPVSFSAVMSYMEKNRVKGYGEDKHLAFVMIAAASLQVVLGIFVYSTCMATVFPLGFMWGSKWWQLLQGLVIQLLMGIAAGLVLGLLAAFFPNRHDKEAPLSRILFIGTASMALAIGFSKLGQAGAGVLSIVILNVVAGNMWEELGWHESCNPVIYFYAVLYYLAQPIIVSLVGFQLTFSGLNDAVVGLISAVIFLGLATREVACFLALIGNTYPTTFKEKVFICVSWLPKGTLEACFAILLQGKIEIYKDYLEDLQMYVEFQKYATILLRSAILAIIFTSPVGLFTMKFLAPHLLHRI